MPGDGKIVVEGVQMIKRHTRANPQTNIKGGIVEKESPIQISNVALVCKNCRKHTRIKHQVLGGRQTCRGPARSAEARSSRQRGITVSKKEPNKPKKEKKAGEPRRRKPPRESRDRPKGPSEPSRLRVRYSKEIVPALMKHFKYTNIMAVPKLEKIVVNMGLGEAIANAKIMDVAVDELGRITGQRAVVTQAKKSIANFKLRQNMPIGAAVTLRGDRMYEFLDRLISVVLPRVRDFRGVSTRSFDGQRQLHDGFARSVDLSRDFLREGRQDSRNERDDRHDRENATMKRASC